MVLGVHGWEGGQTLIGGGVRDSLGVFGMFVWQEAKIWLDPLAQGENVNSTWNVDLGSIETRLQTLNANVNKM